MPVKKKSAYNPLKKPDTAEADAVIARGIDSFSQPQAPRTLYANVDNKVIVELVKFGQLMLARCEDDAMYLMQGNGAWVKFMFEIIK